MENEQNKERKITFFVGQENKIVAEKIDENILGTSLFADTYKHSLSTLDSYFFNLRKNLNAENFQQFRFDPSTNNVFAFIGERGHGKTSCMQSIITLLESGALYDLKDYENLKREKFFAVKTIDPSFIDSETTIIGVLLATLFKLFKESLEKDGYSENEKYDVIRQFTKVQKDFSNIRSGKDKKLVIDDDLEALSSLSASIDLKDSLNKLIHRVLEFGNKKDATLIIPIDDIDLNSEYATSMAEEIRKYLVMDNVIVLMALKLDQLSNLKKLQYAKEYSYTPNTTNISSEFISEEKIDEMTDRYITKLIPYNHRFYLPTINDYRKCKFEIIKDVKDRKAIMEYDSIMDGIMDLVFKKTHMVFYNSPSSLSSLIPNNLRELRQFVRFLVDMNDKKQVDKDDKILYIDDVNSNQFVTYLIDSWTKSHLESKSNDLINDLWVVTDPIQMNSTALRIIRYKFDRILEECIFQFCKFEDNPNVSDEVFEINEIYSARNNEYNIALGDVLAVIYYLENHDITKEESDFLFMIKTIYTIRLQAYYLEFAYKEYTYIYVDHLGNVYKTETKDARDAKKNKIERKDAFSSYKLTNYHKLVGGRLFNTRVICEWTSTKKVYKGNNFRLYTTNRRINVKKIKEAIKDLFDANKFNENNVVKLQLLEFFMLCTAYPIDDDSSKNAMNPDYDKSFRSYPELVYAKKCDGDIAFFDLGAFYFNAIDVERCYGRFLTTKQLEEIKKVDDSLYKKLCLDKEDPWYSWAYFRNIEILMDFINYLDEHIVKAKTDIGVLIEFFITVGEYSISIYKGNNTEIKVIKDTNVNIFTTLLNEIENDNNKSVKVLFDDIFNSTKKNKKNKSV